MRASLIMIGDELVSGRVQDTNGHWLANRLSRRGLSPRRVLLVRDDEGDLREALRSCWADSKLVVTTGGLGPTPDDKTKAILSTFFSAPLEHHPEAWELARKHYARRRRTVPPENTYHLLPRGFAPLPNPHGLAPGLFFSQDDKILACLPGVPREMEMMAEDELFPRLETPSPPEVLTVRTHGVTEEDIFLKLCPGLWERMSSFGKVSSLPRSTGIDLHITLTSSPDELKKILGDSPLNPHIWQFGNISLPALILKKMKKRNLTLALAESATGGLLSSLITDVPGASDSFLGSVTAYNNRIKHGVLSVPMECLRTDHGPVNAGTARAMAKGALKLYGSDLAIAITGLAGPPSPSDSRPVGSLVIGTATAQGDVNAKEYHFTGTRQQIKERFAIAGLFDLLVLLNNS